MTALNRVARCACLAATLVSCFASNALAETTLLVCDASDFSFKITVDFTSKTVQVQAASGEVYNAQANITDAMITFQTDGSKGSYQEYKIDRVTGIESSRPCDADHRCGGWYVAKCHKGSQQF